MARSRLMDGVRRIARIVAFSESQGIRPSEALQRAEELQESRRRRVDRREFLKLGAGAALAAGSTWMLASPSRARPPGVGPTQRRVAIIGGGLAGLTCADYLQTKGIVPTIYEAAPKLGGRCSSLSGFFPGQTAEIGGELIDNLHKTMLGYANAFNLAKEDLGKAGGEVDYYFNGQLYDEAQVVEQFAIYSRRAADDLRTASGSPSALTSNAQDRVLDALSIEQYLATRAADLPLLRAVLKSAYEGEYGLDASQQSALNMLLFMHNDRRRKMAMFGVFSDERYHLVNGNEGVVQGIAAKLQRAPLFGRELTALARNASGEYAMTFRGQSAPVLADAVVLTVPFSVLRGVQLAPSLGIPANQLHAIQTLGYGTNDKTMVGFNARPWVTAHDSPQVYIDGLPNAQIAWETNFSKAGPGGILTDYASGTRGVAIQGTNVQSQVNAWLTDLERVWPGVRAAATVVNGKYRAIRSGWPSNPLSKGSYTGYKVNQFTTVLGLEGKPVGQLKFAGEHANSFYEWQGFMEGACLSGIAAANQVLDDIKKGAL